MKLIISDNNKKELLSTVSLESAYLFLEKVVPPQHLASIKMIKNAIRYDRSREKEKSHFAFHCNDTEKEYIGLEVFYEE